MWRRMDAERSAAAAQAPAPPMEKRRSAAIEALSRRTSVTMAPPGMLALLAEEPEGGEGAGGGSREVKRSAAVTALMQRKTLLNDQSHESVGLVNGHLVRAGDSTHHRIVTVDGDEDGERQSLTRFDPEVSQRARAGLALKTYCTVALL